VPRLLSFARRALNSHADRARRTAFACLLALVVSSGAAYLGVGSAGAPRSGNVLEQLDVAVHDLILSVRPPESYLPSGAAATQGRDPRSFITIVAIDERTLAELGAYNGGYPRSYHAQVIENLLVAPPRVIAFDLGFFEPTADDDRLVAALDAARGLPVPTSIVLSGAGLRSTDQNARTVDGKVVFERGLMPLPALAERASIGLANVVPDDRGTIRGTPLLAEVGGVERPTLGLAAIAKYLRRAPTLDGRPDLSTVQFAGRSIPIDETGSMRINFFGPPSRPYAEHDTYRVVSFVDVLRGHVDPAVWRGGLVFVGALGATGLADDYWTPVSQQGRKMAGVEIHANVAATLFSTSHLSEPPPWARLAMIVAVVTLLAVLAVNLELLAAGVVSLIVLLGVAAAAAWALYAHGLLLPLSTPLLGGVVAFVVGTGPRLAVAQRQTRSLRMALAVERAEVAHLATHDALTGLANRAELVSNLRELCHASRQRTRGGALLLLNLDHFKDINDALGQAAGDALLRLVAQRLRSIELGATRLQARSGGDEFAIVFEDIDDGGAASACVQVLREFEVPFELETRQLVVGASLGVAVYPHDADDAETLLSRADLAMHRAKQAHLGYALFTPTQDQQPAERLALVGALRQAVAGDQLQLYCQPKVSCRDGQLAGVEALVRWHHPQRGLIPPDQFIPLAEQTGLIRPLTRWVLEAAVRHVRGWLDDGLRVKVAVNLSTLDLQDLDLPDYVSDLLVRFDVPVDLLTIEITESALLADPSRAQWVLQALADRGVGASLDDFGTGYSSMTYLKQFPLQELKIDRSFVRDIARGARDREIVRSTIELGHRLELQVVAEGVEDQRTLGLLAELGCDFAQGYHIGRPMPCADLPAWLAASDATPLPATHLDEAA
jgi:diguanylate cyclase (GGDEF)-like protein